MLLTGMGLGAYAAEPVDKELILEARHVLEYLQSQYGKKTLAGSTSGVAPFIYEATGRLPAIQSFDLSGWNSPTWGKTYTPVVDSSIAAAMAWWHKGGIVSMQFHWKNPTRPDGSAWAGTPPAKGTGPVDVAAAITPGTPVNTALMEDLKKHADYLQKLAEAEFPVLWRPFHEIDGGWFWWTATAQSENTAALWRLEYDYLVKGCKLHKSSAFRTTTFSDTSVQSRCGTCSPTARGTGFAIHAYGSPSSPNEPSRRSAYFSCRRCPRPNGRAQTRPTARDQELK